MDEIKNDISLTNYSLDNLPRLKRLLEQIRETKKTVCIERAKYITEYMKSGEADFELKEVKRAKAVAHYLKNKEIIFHDSYFPPKQRNLIAGSTTSKYIGTPVYPEVLEGMTIWPELDTISKREKNPIQLSKEDAEKLNFDIYPYWLDKTILEVTRTRLVNEKSKTLQALKTMESLTFFLSALATVISHTTPFYEKVLAKGLINMKKEAQQKLNDLDGNNVDKDVQAKKDFYEAMMIAMDGIMAYAKNISETAKKLADQTVDPEEQKYYQELSKVCAQIPAKPARSFREAINSLWLCQVSILAENINMAVNPGRLDQILYPYFKKDVEQNIITIEESLELIGCLWIKLNDNDNLVPESSEKLFGGAGTVPAVTLGGVNEDNEDAVNDLTYLMLKVTELLSLRDPNVNARYYSGVNDKSYIKRVSEVINKTRCIPAIFNDKANIDSLNKQIKNIKHSRDYAVVGCVELVSPGREYSESPAALINLPSVMDMFLFEDRRPALYGKKIGPITNFNEIRTYEDFQRKFKKTLYWMLNMSIDLNNELGKTWQEILPTPLLSCFFNGPLKFATDLIDGGALYNSSGATHIGFADLSDSLSAIEDAVFTNNVCDLNTMIDAVKANFEGSKKYERLHEYLINKASKYGCVDRHANGINKTAKEDPIAYKTSRWLIKTLYEFYQDRVNYRVCPEREINGYKDGLYRPAYWTETLHAAYGKLTRALPSGRKEYELFASGMTPVSQIPLDLTVALRSTADLDHKYIPGGYALNMKYSPESSDCENPQYLSKFISTVESFFTPDEETNHLGGMHIQFNLHTYVDFQNAKNYPDDPKWRWLLVRVSGYSAYFFDLTEQMKDEIITRSQYGLCSGKLIKL